jgi:pimeloyl-ACP methyl ester carboxylesterase
MTYIPSEHTIVFIHGSGDNARVWDMLIARLPEYRCIALDLPGHGALVGEPGPDHMGVAEYAGTVRQELARRGLATTCLVGHSLGSAIALRLAAEAPEAVARLGLIGAGARLRVLPSLLEGALTNPSATGEELVVLGMTNEHEPVARAWAAACAPSAPGVLHRDLAACDAFDMMGELANVHQPTLVLTGEEDHLTPPKYARYLGEHLPRAQVEILPHAGHYCMLEEPAAVAAALRRWLPA